MGRKVTLVAGTNEKELVVLGQVAEVLDLADARDRRFYFAAKDLA